MLKRSQILGIFILIVSLSLGFLWEKTFKFGGVLDFVFGACSALGLSMILKLLPIFRKLDR